MVGREEAGGGKCFNDITHSVGAFTEFLTVTFTYTYIVTGYTVYTVYSIDRCIFLFICML